jgi:hypothetical protein
MKNQDEIVVFKRFENAIDANLAKTKLDAYGIPCFLTEENLANLYASQSFMLFGVRLHIFSQDAGRVQEILTENVADQDPTICPRCKSFKIEIEYSRKIGHRLLSFLSLIIASLLPVPKVYRCQQCEFEF